MKQALLLFIVPLFCFSQYTESDWEDRDSWMPVDRIFELAGVVEGIAVADIGCHEGYLSIHLAERVGEGGKVFAVDIRQDRLDLLAIHLDERDINNVEIILGEFDNPKLPKNSLDLVMIVDTYHEMTTHKKILKHIYKSLKAGGKLLILEKLKSWVKNGTRDEQTDAHALSSKYVIPELESAGYKIIHKAFDLGNWEEDEDKPMWLVIGQKPE